MKFFFLYISVNKVTGPAESQIEHIRETIVVLVGRQAEHIS